MRFTELAKTVEKFAVDNSPLLLTVVGVTGTLSTAYLAGKASFKAATVLETERIRVSMARTGEPDCVFDIPVKDKVKLTWVLYIPAAVSATMTCGAIIGANQISTKRTAAIAAAYSISEKAWGEYKDKVVEKLGENKERAVRDELAQDRVNRNPVGNTQVIIAGGESLCYDGYSGRYFKGDVEKIRGAVNEINYQINNNSYASLSDFYGLIGLPRTEVSDEMGWTSDGKLVDIEFSTVMSEDQKPCIAISFRVLPIRGYWYMHP